MTQRTLFSTFAYATSVRCIMTSPCSCSIGGTALEYLCSLDRKACVINDLTAYDHGLLHLGRLEDITHSRDLCNLLQLFAFLHRCIAPRIMCRKQESATQSRLKRFWTRRSPAHENTAEIAHLREKTLSPSFSSDSTLQGVSLGVLRCPRLKPSSQPKRFE